MFPGEYKLRIYDNVGAVPATRLHTDGGVQTVRLIEALEVRGRVTDTDGNPIIPTGNSPVWINAQDANGMTRSAGAGADGTFRVPGLAPGAVKINVWAQGYKYVSVEAVAGDHDIAIQLEKKVKKK